MPIAGLDVVGCTTKFPSIVVVPSFKPNVSALAVFAVLETNLSWAPSIVPSAVAISSYPGAVPISTLPVVFEAGVIEWIVLNKPEDYQRMKPVFLTEFESL